MTKYTLTEGQQIGQWTLLKRDGWFPRSPSGRRNSAWLCQCNCGSEKRVRGIALKRGYSKSCGCIPSNQIHGMYKHPLYRVWQSMKYRCSSTATTAPKHRYHNRGIQVCEEWQDFLSFYEWAKDKWKPGLVIDRRDNNSDYSSENCRFVTRAKITRME